MVWKVKKTRMPSSRMRAARLMPVSPSVHCSWGCVPARGCTCPGVCVPAQGCVYLPGGCTCLGGVPAQGVYLPWGCTCPGGCTCQGVYLLGGVPARGFTCPGGVPAGGGCTCPGGVPAQRGTCPGTPPMYRILDTHY